MKIESVLVSIFLFSTAVFAKTGADREKFVLENSAVCAEFDAHSGALMRLIDKHSGWEIMERGFLGQSFEILLPMEGEEMTAEDKRFNVINGNKQKNPVVERTEDGLIFTWSGLKSEHMENAADITFRGEVRLTDKGLEFGGQVENNSPYHIEYVSWPFIGEICVPDKNQPLLHSTRCDRRELFPHMFNQHGYWGVDYPTSTYVLPEKSYLQVHDSERGFMVYNKEYPNNITITSFELIPGYEIRGVNPYGDEMDGEAVRIQFKVNNCVYAMPGEKADLDKVQFAPYKGGWEEGVRLYREDRLAYASPYAINVNSTPDWLGHPQTWCKTSAGNPEELVLKAKEYASLGVDALLVHGWTRNSSGHISEVSGLEDAIEQCQALGMKVILETTWNITDRHSPAYMNEYRGYVMSDQFINLPYNYEWLCPCSQHVTELAEKEWLSLPAFSSADGYMNRDHNNTNHSLMCFDTDHGHRPGEPTARGAMNLDAKMAAAICKNPDIAALGMGYDRYQDDIYAGNQVSVGDRDYARERFTAPHKTMILPVRTRSARRDLNDALLYSFIPVYELNFFGNSLGEYPNIHSYGKQIEKLNTMYADRLWNAEFVYHSGASVTGYGIEWSVYKNAEGKHTVVIVNKNTENESEVNVDINGATSLLCATPEHPETALFPGKIVLEPQRAAIIMEK